MSAGGRRLSAEEAGLMALASACEASGCALARLPDWAVEHWASEDLGCPGWCRLLGELRSPVTEDACGPGPCEIPF